MRIAVYFNPTAGGDAFDGRDVVHLLRLDGWDAELFTKGNGALGDAIGGRPDVLVAAGGDGTVAKAAIGLWKRRSSVPLYVLPVGTANNIARTLGVRATVPVLVRALARARQATLDVGVVRAGSDETAFVEATGVGFFGRMLHHSASRMGAVRRWIRHQVRGRTEGDAEVRAAARGVARVIRSAPPRRYAVIADGIDLSGEYVAVEAMNVRSIGPRLPLAPNADPGDGHLHLVFVRAGDRESLARAVAAHGTVPSPPMECHCVREVELSVSDGDAHVDDEPWCAEEHGRGEGGRVRVALGGSIPLLLPDLPVAG